MKILFQLVVALVIFNHVLSFRTEWKKFRRVNWQTYASAKGDDPYEALRLRLQDKLNQNKVEVKVNLNGKDGKPTLDVGKKTEKVVQKQEKVVQKQAQNEKKEVKQEVQAVQKTAAPVSKVVTEKVSNAQVMPPSNGAISGVEVAEGVGLGLLPYLLIPVLLFNAVEGLLKKPKVPSKAPSSAVAKASPTKAQTYTKSLSEGAKEGVKELQSGKQTKDLNDIRNGYKIATASFGLAAAVAVGSLLFGGGGGEGAADKTKELSKTENKVVQVQTKKPVAVVKKEVKEVKKDSTPAVKKDQASNTASKTKDASSPSEVQKPVKPAESAVKKEEAPAVKLEVTAAEPAATPAAAKIEIKAEKPPAPTPLTPTPTTIVTQPIETKPVVQVREEKVEKTVEVQKITENERDQKKVAQEANTNSAIVSEVKPIEKVKVEKAAPVAVVQEKVEVPKAQVVTVEGTNTDSKKKPVIVQQAQPDVVDLSKFQSLRNKKN